MDIPSTTELIKNMNLAFAQAKKGAQIREVPVGSLLIQNGKVIARAHNLTRTWHDPTAHAEMVVIQKAAKKLKNERLLNSTLYITLEPCAMCAGAIVQARIPIIVYGTPDPKAGACGSALKILGNKKLNHKPRIIKNILEDRCRKILKDFFKKRR